MLVLAVRGQRDKKKDSKRSKRPKEMANFGAQIGKLKNKRLKKGWLLIC